MTLHGTLMDAGTDQTAAEFTVTGNEIKNNKINRLKFQKVENTKGKEYTLVLACERSDEQNGLSFYVTQGNVGKLSVKGNHTNGVLVCRMLCHRFHCRDIYCFAWFCCICLCIYENIVQAI